MLRGSRERSIGRGYAPRARHVRILSLGKSKRAQSISERHRTRFSLESRNQTPVAFFGGSSNVARPGTVQAGFCAGLGSPSVPQRRYSRTRRRARRRRALAVAMLTPSRSQISAMVSSSKLLAGSSRDNVPAGIPARRSTRFGARSSNRPRSVSPLFRRPIPREQTF